MIQPSTIKFLKELKKNNTKEWFDNNRKQYDAAKTDFAQFVQEIIEAHSKKDPSIAALTAKECMFRINRDVRFSKDKSPYKTNFGASINAGGKKSMTAGYYIHLEPGGAFAGGGLYMPMPEELKKVRQEIDYCFTEFSTILNSKKFRSVYNGLDRSQEFMLSRPPKGYDEQNPAIEYLKLKSFIAFVPLDDALLSSKDCAKTILKAFDVLQPLIAFLNRALEV